MLTLNWQRLLITLFFLTPLCTGGEPSKKVTKDPHAQRHQASIQRAEQLLERKTTAQTLSILGDAQLRAGKIEPAITSFEQAIEKDIRYRPHLWQYGIALFFAGRHQDAAKLFEEHREVNPNDVENAAWHFLCVAKASELATARNLLLPAPNDPRAPMEEVLQRLPGGDNTAIEDAIKETKNTSQFDSARFYGDLYMGLIADAEGRGNIARRYIERAAAVEQTHYMADVARIYNDYLSSKLLRAATSR